MASNVSETTALLTDNNGLRSSLEHAYSTEPIIKPSTTEEATTAIKPASPEPQTTTTWKTELQLLLKHSAPLNVAFILQYALNNFTTIFFVGRVSIESLGAVQLAFMTANVFGFAIYEGLATSLDTLCAQAYGSGRKELVGLHLQRMVYFQWLVTVPIAVVWFCATWILEAVIPEKELAALAGSYLKIMIFGTFGFSAFEAGKRFVQAQGFFNAPLFVLLICGPLNVLLHWLFVWMGIRGGATAVVITNNLMPVLLLLYVLVVNPTAKQCWPGLTLRALHNWGPMVRLSIPGVVMVEAEWLAFDILNLAAAHFSTAHLAAQSILMTTSVLMYHIPFPISIAASTRLGNLIGSDSLAAARVAAKTHLAVFTIVGILDVALLSSPVVRRLLPRIFTSDQKVIDLVASVMPVVAAFQLFDAFVALANGHLRGLGRQSVGGWVNLTVYYLLAVPLAFTLGFGPLHWRLWGLWSGLAVGLAVICTVEGLFIWRMSWQDAVEDAKGRNDAEEENAGDRQTFGAG